MMIRTIAPVRASAPASKCSGCPRAATCTTGLNGLGCSGCPCAGTCGAKNGLSGLGCSCTSCPNRSTCPRSQTLGALALPSIDMSDWRTWALIVLAVGLLYQMFFSTDKRAKRRARSNDLRAARDRYSDQVRKIREEYA